jgi:hypothetical protein
MSDFILNNGELPAQWVGHCNRCVQPITNPGALRRALYWLCYQWVMYIPGQATAATKWQGAILARAGGWAFECGCENRRAALQLSIKRPPD